MKDKELMATIARNMKARRLELGMSQEDLVEASGVKIAYISRLERGLTNPSATTIQALCTALKIKPSKLLGF